MGKSQSEVAPCRKWLDAFDRRFEGRNNGPIQTGRRHEFRPHPDQAAAQGHREPEPSDASLKPSAIECKAPDSHGASKAQQAGPGHRSVEREPTSDPHAEADGQPQGQLAALALEEAFRYLARSLKPRPPKAPSTLWKRRSRYVRGARPLHCTIEKRGKCA
jgi:hypothetical protein